MPFNLTLASARLGPSSQMLCEDTGQKPFGVVDTPEYLKMNPTRHVPTLLDGDLAVWESHSIVRYVAAKYAPALHLGSVEGMAQCSPWMDWVLWANFHDCNHHFVDQMARTEPGQRDPAIVESAHEGYMQRLQLVEQRLAETNAFVCGDSFTIADIPIGAEIARWSSCLENWSREAERGALPPLPDSPTLPHIGKFFQRLQQRPAFVSGCLAHEREHHLLPVLPSADGPARLTPDIE